ncbi:MAG: complex I subunit 1 family protein [Candidatus Thiodiazotropha sp.]
MMSEVMQLLLASLVFPGGLFVALFGLYLKGVDRKLIARLQARVGPPLTQSFFDTLKLMNKETLIPRQANVPVFLGAPLFGFAAMAFAPVLIPVPGFYQPPVVTGDVLVLLYLLAVPGIVIMLSGSSSGSLYGAIGFSREMSLILAYEGPLLFALVAVAVYVGQMQGGTVALSLNEILAYQEMHGANLLQPVLWPALLAYLACLPATLGVPPFDIAEAETEILEGPLIEYSGPALGLLQLMQAMQRVVALALGVVLFFPTAPEGIWGLIVFVLKILVMAMLAITLLRASIGRMRIDQAIIFFFTWPEAAGLLSLILIVFFA